MQPAPRRSASDYSSPVIGTPINQWEESIMERERSRNSIKLILTSIVTVLRQIPISGTSKRVVYRQWRRPIQYFTRPDNVHLQRTAQPLRQFLFADCGSGESQQHNRHGQ